MQGIILPISLVTQLMAAAYVEPQWQNDYATALRTARTEHRPLVVVLDDPNNPNRAIDDSKLFENQGLSSKLRQFELCRIDITTTSGKKVAKAFRASSFPYTAVTDKSCSVIVHRKIGDPSQKSWTELLVLKTSANRRLKTDYPTYQNLISPRKCYT